MAATTRCLRAVVILLGVAGTLIVVPQVVSHVWAQSAPQSYTVRMVQTEMFTGQSATVVIHRDGSRELVIKTIPPSPQLPKGLHQATLYDFAAQRMYTRDEVHKTCNWMRYTSVRAPLFDDPIGGSQKALADMAGQKPNVERKVTVNGFPTTMRVYPGPEGKGELRIWVADDRNLLVQMHMVNPDGTIPMKFEVQNISYAKPAPTLLAPPANCAQTQGEANESGMTAHAESEINAQASVEKDLGSGATRTTTSASSTTKSTASARTAPKPAAPAAGGLPLGKWAFKGQDSKAVVWTGHLLTTKNEGYYECEFAMSSDNGGRGASARCEYDPVKRTLTMNTGKGQYVATLGADGKSLTRGKWADDDFGKPFTGTWNAVFMTSGTSSE